MLAQSYRSKKAQAPCGSRPRSASADTVLLHRGSPPLWVLAESPVTLEELHYSRDAKQWSRKHRAMSVPNAAATGAIHSLSIEKSSKPQEEESRAKRIPQQPAPTPSPAVTRAPSEEDSSELDYGCEDTHSESTSDSSCTSPRHTAVTHHFTEHSPVSLDVLHEDEHRVSGDEMDDFSDYMTPEDEEEDYEAYQLLDRINSLAAEFKAHRTYEESSALAWSVQHAARQGAISPQLQQNLLSSIRNGAWEEARDVLYHKCHLVPAVGSVAEPATSSSVDPAIEASFEQCIDTLSPTDSSDARLQKLRVLKILSDLLTTWVKLVGYERGLTEEHIALTSGSLFLAGSYRLGLNDPLSDIDAVCVVPWHVTHEDFFSSFCAMLEQTSGVTHLAPVPNAYVPLISLSFMDVSMDLLFARLPMTGVETHQEIDSDHILVNVDPTSMKSLNAPRVSSMLLCLVPRRRVFRIVLRAVRAWARRRGVYSSKLGYLGGISWSILVAFVCQMYPDAEPSKLFVRFFQVFSEWQWPRPVMLNMVYDAGLGFEMWDPRQNLYDRSHIMPIVTPAYPHMNSAVQVSQSTFSVIYEELWRARYLAEAADGIARSIGAAAVAVADSSSQVVGASEPLGGAPSGLYVETTSSPTMTQAVASAAAVSGAQFEWDKLFQRSNFFIRYDSYLVVDFHAETSASMHVWGKFVHSRLRKLVDSLQHLSAVTRVHAFPLYFPTTSTGHAPGSCMVIGMEFQSRSRSNSDMHGLVARVDPEVQANLDRTIRFFLATDLQQLAERKQDMVAEARLLTWGELPEFVFEHGRPAAMVERAEYHEDMEHMMLQSHGGQYRSPYSGGGSGDRYGSGKWRSPNGNHSRLRTGSGSGSRYFGSKGGKQARGNGGGGGQKPYYMAQGG
jgi:poly(A) polymerase